MLFCWFDCHYDSTCQQFASQPSSTTSRVLFDKGVAGASRVGRCYCRLHRNRKVSSTILYICNDWGSEVTFVLSVTPHTTARDYWRSSLCRPLGNPCRAIQRYELVCLIYYIYYQRWHCQAVSSSTVDAATQPAACQAAVSRMPPAENNLYVSGKVLVYTHSLANLGLRGQG